jgi:hypothetical protein
MKHFEEQQRNVAEKEEPITAATCATLIIPEEIWEAMAAIDLVKKELMSQDALETLERSETT